MLRAVTLGITGPLQGIEKSFKLNAKALAYMYMHVFLLGGSLVYIRFSKESCDRLHS